MKKKVSVVVPTIREDSIKKFIGEWEKDFFYNKDFDVHLTIVEDNPAKQFKIKENKAISHYSWQDVDRDFAENSWIIPRRSDCIRSFGYWKAWLERPDMIVTLDDDCYPLHRYQSKEKLVNQNDFLKSHWERLTNGVTSKQDFWVNTTQLERTRGTPYFKRAKEVYTPNIILNHGLWYNVPDLDARTQLEFSKIDNLTGFEIDQVIPKQKYYPMCGMNLSWKPAATPALYFLLMGQNNNEGAWGFDRFGDIWSGIMFKKIADHLGYSVASGYPIIWHSRASNVLVNLKKEAAGIEVNETFWEAIDGIELKGEDFRKCYREIALKLSINGKYWNKLKKAMQVWASLFK